MNWTDIAVYAAGWSCLIAIAALSLWSLWCSIAPNLGRIADVLYGRPVTPAASATPQVARTSSRRGVEAAAAPTARAGGIL